MPHRRYYVDIAAAYVRGAHPRLATGDDAATVRAALGAGVDLFRFKRRDGLARVEAVLSLLRGLHPADLLDLGFGRGSFLFPFLDAFPEPPVTAVELHEPAVALLEAVKRGGYARVTPLQADITDLPVPDAAFDLVTALEVLEHLERPLLAAEHAVRAARRFVVASVPSKPDDNPEHVQLFTPASLEALFLAAGARKVRIQHLRGHIIALASVEEA